MFAVFGATNVASMLKKRSYRLAESFEAGLYRLGCSVVLLWVEILFREEAESGETSRGGRENCTQYYRFADTAPES